MLVMELFRLEGGRGVVKDGLCGHMWCPTASLQTELQCRAITASFIPMSPSNGETIPGRAPLGSTLGPSALPLQQEKCGHPYYLAAENRVKGQQKTCRDSDKVTQDIVGWDLVLSIWGLTGRKHRKANAGS